MLVYIDTDGKPHKWGHLLYVDDAGAWLKEGGLPWHLGHRKNGYRGTFGLVCPD